MTKSHAIEVKKLFKVYKGNIIAINNIDLNIPHGSIFGLLGPNGAGKSSFINILAGLVSKSSGSVKICDVDIDSNPKTARGAIGVVPQEVNIDPYFTPIEILNNQAGYYGISSKDMQNKTILRELNLFSKANAYSRSLSGGMKRRLMIAKAIVHRPPVLVLDEPTAGVDVELRQKLWTYIKKLNKSGTTIILTTHYLEEAEKLCDQIAIINKGRIIVSKTKDELLKIIDTKEIHIQLKQPINKVPHDLFPYLLKHNKDLLIFRYRKNMTPTGKIIKLIMKNKLDILELTTRETDLEEIFLKLLKSK